MRSLCMDTQQLKKYNVSDQPFWDACAKGFEAMFKPCVYESNRLAPHVFAPIDGERFTEELKIDEAREHDDWCWYVKQRISYTHSRDYRYSEHFFENRLYEYVKELEDAVNSKPILILHGRTGVGKTTLIRYFFSSYLHKIDPERGRKTFALRISMSDIARRARQADDEFDHALYKFLIDKFKHGKYDLTSRENLIEMACMEYPSKQEMREYFRSVAPPPIYVPEQLNWVREKVVARMKKSPEKSDVSEWADFNRIAIKYLGKIDPKLRIVVIFDNVDHLPVFFQKAAWILARRKLAWIDSWNSICIIIAIRTYLLDSAAKEDTFQGYSGKYREIELMPPSLYEVLCTLKKLYFDPLYPKRDPNYPNEQVSCHLKLRHINLPLYCPNELLNQLLLSFKERTTDNYISLICNHDIRQGKEIAKAIIQYPFFNWADLSEVVRKQYMQHETDVGKLISHEKALDALIRRKNLLCDPELPFFDNMYNVDSTDHYSNSLCKLFIIKILDRQQMSAKSIIEMMNLLGHDQALVDTAIARLLLCNIITSPEGVDLHGHNLIRLASSDTTLCKQYLQKIHSTLFYLQGFAYRTPIDDSFVRRIPQPDKIEEDNRTFCDRVRAASILFKQIRSDMSKQIIFINNINNKDHKERAMRIFNQNDFISIVPNIQKNICKDLDTIDKNWKNESINFQKLRMMFK